MDFFSKSRKLKSESIRGNGGYFWCFIHTRVCVSEFIFKCDVKEQRTHNHTVNVMYKMYVCSWNQRVVKAKYRITFGIEYLTSKLTAYNKMLFTYFLTYIISLVSREDKKLVKNGKQALRFWVSCNSMFLLIIEKIHFFVVDFWWINILIFGWKLYIQFFTAKYNAQYYTVRFSY